MSDVASGKAFALSVGVATAAIESRPMQHDRIALANSSVTTLLAHS